MLQDKQFSIDIQAKVNENINIELLMSIWKIDEQTNHFHLYFNQFETAINRILESFDK
jgi:hypothetical protein